jgi:MFS family permease
MTMIIVGSVRDGFMAIFFTSVNETRGVDSAYSGLAIGFTMVFMGIGNLIAPPLGNSLASQTNSGAPLMFWAALVIFGAVCLILISGRKPAPLNRKIGSNSEH